MPDVTPDSVKAKNAARSVDEESILRYKGERLTFERRYFPSLGQAGGPVLVWTSDNHEIHGNMRQFVSGDGDYLKAEGVDDGGSVVFSTR